MKVGQIIPQELVQNHCGAKTSRSLCSRRNATRDRAESHGSAERGHPCPSIRIAEVGQLTLREHVQNRTMALAVGVKILVPQNMTKTMETFEFPQLQLVEKNVKILIPWSRLSTLPCSAQFCAQFANAQLLKK